MIKQIFRKILNQKNYQQDLDDIKILAAQLIIQKNKNVVPNDINEVELKVFSQWGEDGIIQFLINKIPIENKVFVEFGVENYIESNTRFLLINNNWSGLVLDGNSTNISFIKKDNIYWKYDLIAKELFINKNNINEVLYNYIRENCFTKNIGLLSIDIDGNDYHIWESIDSINPAIVICEYNWIYGNKHEITVPYDENFNRTKMHFSNLYFGASIQALYKLAKAKGYEYIGATSAGNDAFFVKRELAKKYLSNLITTPNESFFEQKAKESRDIEGNLTYIRGDNRKEVIRDMIVYDLKDNKLKKLKDLQ